MGGNNNISMSTHSTSTMASNTQQRSLRKMVKNARYLMEKRDGSGKLPPSSHHQRTESRRQSTEGASADNDDSCKNNNIGNVGAHPWVDGITPRPATQRRGSTGGGVPLAYFGGAIQTLQFQSQSEPHNLPGKVRRQSTGTYNTHPSCSSSTPSTTLVMSKEQKREPNITLSISGRWNTPLSAPSVRMPPRRMHSGSSSRELERPPQPPLPSRSWHSGDNSSPRVMHRYCSMEAPPQPRVPLRNSTHSDVGPPQPRAPIRRHDEMKDSSSTRRSQDAVVLPPPTPTMALGCKSFRPTTQHQLPPPQLQACPPSPTHCISPFRAPFYHVIQEESHDSFNSSVSSVTFFSDSSSQGILPTRDRSVTPLQLENEEEEVEEEEEEEEEDDDEDDEDGEEGGSNGMLSRASGLGNSDCSLISDLSSSLNGSSRWASSLGVMAS